MPRHLLGPRSQVLGPKIKGKIRQAWSQASRLRVMTGFRKETVTEEVTFKLRCEAAQAECCGENCAAAFQS